MKGRPRPQRSRPFSSRGSYGGPTSQRRGPETPIGFCRTQAPRHGTVVKRDGVGFHRDYIPPPLACPQVSAPAVRSARWCRPNFLLYSSQTQNPRHPISAFAQVTGLRPKTATTDSSTTIWIPQQGVRKGPWLAFPQVRSPFSTWWQVKDSNLRSFRDGFTDQQRHARDQRRRPFHRQLTCVFPTDTRRQPTIAGRPSCNSPAGLSSCARNTWACASRSPASSLRLTPPARDHLPVFK